MSNKNLETYRKKRKFDETEEPQGTVHATKSHAPIFVIQKHDARSLHYDFRLEADGVLKSWALPKGPSTDPKVKHLAVHTEDHPYDYKDFEGVIPEGNYGAGGVIIWDRGTYINLKAPKSIAQCIHDGTVSVWLQGEKLHGGFALIKAHLQGKDSWLFFKMKDEEADADTNIIEDAPKSVISGKTITEIEEDNE